MKLISNLKKKTDCQEKKNLENIYMLTKKN